MKRFLAGLAGFLCFASSFSTTGQAYPDRAIKVIVAHAAGTAIDSRARQIAERLSKVLKQPVVVENRAGAGGTIGAHSVTQAEPDGHTLLFAGNAEIVIAPSFYPKLPYDPLKDLVPISQAVRGQAILVAGSHLKVRSISELLSIARAKPRTVTVASMGNGTSSHLLLLELMHDANVELIHVPYKNGAQAISDVIAGQVDMMFDFVPSTRQHIQSGKLIPLITSGDARLDVLPSVPTARESGLKNVRWYVFGGLMAPKGTPRKVVDVLHKEFARIILSPDMRRIIEDTSGEAIGNTPEEFGAVIADDHTRVKVIVKRTGATLD